MGALEEAAARLGAARSITVLTGAGVSAASGIPTFRGPGGLWRTYRAEDLATPEAFLRDPRLVWEWYDWRRTVVGACTPNPAHDVLARWMYREGFTLITQNVDGLHEKAMETFRPQAAAAPRSSVIRVHGSIWELRCTGPCGGVWEDRTTPLPSLPPRCPECGALARPNVVWFGEALDPAVLARCDQALDCGVFLSIGTSSVVYPAAGLVHEAKRRGAFTVEVNPAATDATGVVDLAIPMPAEEALPLLERNLENLHAGPARPT